MSDDPLGKRALYWVPTERAAAASPRGTTPAAAPLGKRVLFSGAAPSPADVEAGLSDNPLASRGPIVVECASCGETTRIGVLDYVIFQLPIGWWFPRGRFDRRMTCPACRRRAWVSVALRHRSPV